MTQSLRSADGRKLVHERKCMELKLFLPGSPGGSKKKKKKKITENASLKTSNFRICNITKQNSISETFNCFSLFRIRYYKRWPKYVSTGSASRKLVEKNVHLFFYPIASLVPPPTTHPHAHTPIPGTTQQYHTTAPKLTWLSLLLLLAASQRGAFLAPLSPATCITRRQQPAISMPFCQQQLRLPQLWRLSAECNATNVALAAFG